MTDREDLLGRLKELHTGQETLRSRSRSIQKLINHGDLAGATTALNDLETALHPVFPHWRSVTLQPDDILALDTTPFELVPNPGGRRYIVPMYFISHYRYNMNPYTGTALLSAGWGSTVEEIVNGAGVVSGSSFNPPLVRANEFLAQTFDVYVLRLSDIAYGWPAINIEGLALSLAQGTVTGASPFADGDGTLTMRTFYSVIDGAPPP